MPLFVPPVRDGLRHGAGKIVFFLDEKEPAAIFQECVRVVLKTFAKLVDVLLKILKHRFFFLSVWTKKKLFSPCKNIQFFHDFVSDFRADFHFDDKLDLLP